MSNPLHEPGIGGCHLKNPQNPHIIRPRALGGLRFGRYTLSSKDLGARLVAPGAGYGAGDKMKDRTWTAK